MGSGQIACVQCGQPLGAGIQFCGQCGATQPAPPPQPVQAQVAPAPPAQAAAPAFGAQTVIQLSPSAPAFRPGNAGSPAPGPAPAAPAPAPAPNPAPAAGR